MDKPTHESDLEDPASTRIAPRQPPELFSPPERESIPPVSPKSKAVSSGADSRRHGSSRPSAGALNSPRANGSLLSIVPAPRVVPAAPPRLSSQSTLRLVPAMERTWLAVVTPIRAGLD